MAKRYKHPGAAMSDKIYRGEITGFAEVMRAVRRGMQNECNDTEDFNASLTPDEQWMRVDVSIFQRYEDAARDALSLYAAEMEKVTTRVAEQLRAKGTSEYEQIADALESGDYSTLAW